jgi:trk system potassium uptake protein
MSTPEREPTPARYRRRPGDRVVRRAVSRAETVTLVERQRPRRSFHPALLVVLGFAALILIGTLCLLLPVASADGQSAGVIAALFTATSAVCVTGLVVVDTGTAWTPFGQAVIIVLIQLGGLGFMTSSTLLLLIVLGQRTSLQQRLLLGQTLGGGHPGEVVHLARRIAATALIIELLGAIVLFSRISQEAPVGRAIWWSIFHSVSAFNNAGFDITGGFRSMSNHGSDAWILGTIGLLAFLGAISYTAMVDIIRARRWRRLTVDTKLVLTTTTILICLGVAFLLVIESSNPATLGPMPWRERVLNALFNSVTPRTSGFSSLDVGSYLDQSIFFTISLMFIGGASGSTAGGIKIQTFMLLFFAIVAAFRGRERVVAFGREMPGTLVFRALAVALISVAVIFTVALALTITEGFHFIEILFETVSAFGTVGLSTGITPELNSWSRLIVAFMMFTGRLGPLTLVLALASRGTPRDAVRYASEVVKIG